MTEAGTGVEVMVGVRRGLVGRNGRGRGGEGGGGDRRVGRGSGQGLTARLEGHFLRRVEKIDDAIAQVVQAPGKFGMDGRDEIQGDGQQRQGYQAEQDFYDTGGSFQHGQDYTALGEWLGNQVIG